MEQHHDAQEREEEKWLKSRPVCDMCGEPIQEDHYYEPEPGDVLCRECFTGWVHDNVIREID